MWIFIRGLWPIWALIVIVALGKMAFQIWEQQKLAKSGISEIDQMSGKTFEKYLEVLFEKLGYRVERTRYVGDYGADLVTAKDGVKTVIQAKSYKSKAGVKAIQEAAAAKGYYDCSKAMVVTNSFFTQQAAGVGAVGGTFFGPVGTFFGAAIGTGVGVAVGGVIGAVGDFVVGLFN
jgi:restriction system protein